MCHSVASTFPDAKAFDKARVMDWEARDDRRLDSDHCAITWTIDPAKDTDSFVPPKPTYRYKIELDCSIEWTEAFTTALADTLPPSTYLSLNNCQLGASSILNAMSIATSSSMKRVRVSSLTKRPDWWNAECHEVAERTSI